MPRTTLLRLALGAAALVLVGLGLASLHRPRPPNLLLITLDTVRADRIGAYGGRVAATPTLDALARDGIRFEHAFTPVPLTLPAHATLLTGLQPPGHGLTDNGMRATRFPVATLAERLRAEGYDTAAFVAAFVLHSVHGLDRGFALYDDGPDAAGDVFSQFRATAPAEERVGALIAWLQRPRDRPFFAWLHLFDPHAPYQPPAGFAARYASHPYEGEIAYVDSQLGRITAWLERSGVMQDTLIVVTADHGEGLGEHGEQTHGIFLYDSTLRIPLILHWRGRIAPSVETRPAALVDVMPTVLGLFDLPQEAVRHGVDLLSAEPGDAPWRFVAYSEYPRRQYGWAPLAALREEHLKYIEAPQPELYDLSRDPAELVNLVSVAPHDAAIRLADQLDLATAELAAVAEAGAVDAGMTADVRRRLQSLGYLAAFEPPARGAGPGLDPKEGLPSLGPIETAFEALARQDLAAAEALFRASIAASPDGIAARDGLARTLELAGRAGDAEAEYEAILRRDPEAMLSLGRLVELRTQRGACEAARAPAEALARLLPDAEPVRQRLERCRAAAASGAGTTDAGVTPRPVQ